MTEFPMALKRALKLRDLILLNIVAVYTPSTLAQNMPLGKLGLLVWALAIAGFMLPYATAISRLSLHHPREGGVYAWTRMALGDFHGFLCGWCYWVNTFLYVPSVFLGIAAVIGLLGGERLAWLNTSQFTGAIIASLVLWGAATLHIAGLGNGKWIQNIGAFGRLAMAICLVGVAGWSIVSEKVWDLFADPAISSLPGNTLGFWPALALWPFTLNALVGLDLGSAMSDETDAPSRNIPRSLLIGGLAIAGCYLLTCAAMLVTGFNETNVIYGHVLAINSVLGKSGSRVLLVAASVVILIELLGLLGSGAAWLAAPARVPFAIGIDQYLPKAFARVHPRYGTPYVALIVQAAVATAFIFINTAGASLQEAYLALLGGSIVLVMVTYLYLFASWIRLAATPSPHTKVFSTVGLLATALAIVACFIPPPIVTGIIGFEMKIIGSVAFMLLCGLIVYKLGARHSGHGHSAANRL
jgi:amino acid transporter